MDSHYAHCIGMVIVMLLRNIYHRAIADKHRGTRCSRHYLPSWTVPPTEDDGGKLFDYVLHVIASHL